MSRVYSDTVLPEDSNVSQDFTFGTTGDTVQVTSGATLKLNTLKDAGGNTIWTSDGSGNLSSLNSAFSGKPSLITTNTSTGAASSEFTTNITNAYKLYIFKWIEFNPSADGTAFYVVFSTNGGSSYSTTKTSSMFKSYNYQTGNNNSVVYDSGDDNANTQDPQKLCINVGNGADEDSCGEMLLFNPGSTTYYKHYQSRSNQYDYGDASITNVAAGYIDVAAAIDAVKFYPSSGTMDCIIQMYGL
tara:strand:- start:568 stop:1299 length:732 start_codon:yes stop_codon:yes gene_type:complete